MSSRVIKRTLVASIVLTAASIAQGQHHDSGQVIENVTLISPERMAPLESMLTWSFVMAGSLKSAPNWFPVRKYDASTVLDDF